MKIFKKVFNFITGKLDSESVYYSIRVVKASNLNEAIEEIESENFDAAHPLCDKVLTKKELITFL